MPKLGQGEMPAPSGGPSSMPPLRPGAGGQGVQQGIRDFFNKPMTPQRQDMIMQLVGAGMQSAGGAGSPLLSFLAPLAGGAIGAGTAKRAEKYAGAQSASAMDDFTASLGKHGNNPRVQSLIGVLQNPASPDFMKTTAQAELDRILKPASTGAVDQPYDFFGGNAPSNTDALMAKMFYDAIHPTGDGGATITPGEQSRMDSIKTMRSRTDSGTAAATDDFTSMLDGATPETEKNDGPGFFGRLFGRGENEKVEQSDPLGILSLPPA